MNESEIKHLQELIRAKKDRLHQLELKEARYGLDVPPHICIEIEELRGEIKGLQTQPAALEKEQGAVSRLEEARRQVPPQAQPRRPVNWEKVGAIVGVIAVIIALGVWLLPDLQKAVTPLFARLFPPPGMVYVPAGEFTMGSGKEDSDEQPMHTVYLDAFYIDKHEVTNAQYRACVDAGTCNVPSDTTHYDHANYAQHPVVYVSWNDADTYCQWAGKLLPTETQWEKAARGTNGRIYPWGNAFDGSKLNFCDANCRYDWKDTSANDGYAETAPVGSFPAGASPYGALDMAGNVLEWVADWHDSGYYSQSPALNPPGLGSGEDRVLRGGTWVNTRADARCASRLSAYPDYRNHGVGFRCARGSQ
jgi:formylglycine-generating enzyme required for sulfatase activity